MKVASSSLSSSSIFRLPTPTTSWINKSTTDDRRNPFQPTLFSKSLRSHSNLRLQARYSSPTSTHHATNSGSNLQYQQIESDEDIDVDGDDGTMSDMILSVMKRLLPHLHFTSFCCVFQHMVFSCTPALTVPIMFILLATLPTSDLFVLPGEDGCSTSSVEEKEEEEEEEEEEEGEKEAMAWKKITEEATRLVANTRHEALMDQETICRFVSPLTVEEGKSDDEDMESDVEKKPAGEAEAEVLSEYANFLWLVKKDLVAAEEMYLEAIAADPTNTTHAANYAHFLWNTGGEDTCYPLGQLEEDVDEERGFR